MRRILFDILEINIAVSLVILLVCLMEKKLCKRYGAGCLKAVLAILAIRLLIPYNFSLPFTEMRLLSIPGFEQEESFGTGGISSNSTTVQQNVQFPTVDLLDIDDQQVEQIPEMNMKTESTINRVEVSDAPHIQMQESDVPIQQIQTSHDISGKSIKANAFAYSTILSQLWLVGTVAGFCYFIICSIAFYHRYNKSLRRLPDTCMLNKVNEIQEEIMGRKSVEVYESSAISSPMLIGLLHTKLVFPTSKKQWKEKELEYIVSHELCHYRNKDLWWKLLLLLVWCLNWWNPFILLMKRKCFFYMELVCDECVLKEVQEIDRGEYAEMLLRFAGRRNHISAFSTNFGAGKKRLKQRIDYTLESHRHKKGTVPILLMGLLVISVGLFISCGYKPEEVDREKEDIEQAGEKEVSQQNTVDVLKTEKTEKITTVEFSYNHAYNRGVRCYKGFIYYVKSDGIYRMKENGTEEERLFSNIHKYRRGIDLYGDYLYFSGSTIRGEQEESTIFRLDLETMEVVDVLAVFSQSFPVLGLITIYEDCLYVSTGYEGRIGFKLSHTGDVSRLEEDADFIYKEDDEYALLHAVLWRDIKYQSTEWYETWDKLNTYYVSVVDAAACEKLLNGKRIVRIYKDEAVGAAYMRYEDGSKEYLCDMAYSCPVIITETGMYYSADLSGAVYYLDFETKENSVFLESPKDGRSVWLANYDKEFVYYVKEAPWDPPFESEEGDRLMRIPRQGGNSEVVYEFDKDYNAEVLWGESAVVGDYLYLDEKWIKLFPLTD